MQRKKFLALMLTAALAGQSGTAVPVLAADLETEESDEFGEETSLLEETGVPVITEDLPEEMIVYHLNEKAEPLRIKTEDADLKYQWLKSDDNENFYNIKKEDASQQEETDQERIECDPEYTPATDIPGVFYYKVQIWKQNETAEDAFTESRTVCVQVLDDALDDNENTIEGFEDTDADHDTGSSEEAGVGDQTVDEEENSKTSDTDIAASEASESVSDPETLDQITSEADISDLSNHLPVRQEGIPENETYETEGYWNVDLSEIFQDPDGDELTYYEKDERDENWTEIDGDSYLCHLKENQETYMFTAKDQEDTGEIYAVTLNKKTIEKKQAEENSADSQTEQFSAGETAAVSAENKNFDTVYQETGAHLASLAEKNAPVSGTLCGDWMVIGLVRSGQPVDSSVYSRYLSNVVNTVKEKKGVLHAKKYSEYSRTILGLTAIGEDVTDVGGYNLLEPLSDFKQTIWQGVNGPIWALIAFDSRDYEIPKAAEGKTQTTRENLIGEILNNEVAGGGWSMFGGIDSDMTGMALQALAPYYNSDPAVKAAVDRAIAKLSTIQLEDGTFGTMGHSTSESCSQVVTGLSAMGIDCDQDSRFIKNGKSLLQGLLSYYDGENGFRHVMDNGYDQMATEQAYYAMTAYSRMKNGQTSLYDMTDVAVRSDKEKAAEVTKMIQALPAEITMNNFKQVLTAYAAYNGLNSTQKSVITKTDQEKLLKAYQNAMEVEVKNVETLIRNIGKVTLSSEEKITDAKIAYNSLSDEQKKKVSNYSVLTKAEKELQKLKKGADPTPTAKPSGKPGSTANMVTPKPTSTPKPSSTTGANPSRTKTAGGSTKSVSMGTGKSSKSSAKTGSTKTANIKNKNTTTGKNSSTASASETKAIITTASQKVLAEMKLFFDKKRSDPYPAKIDDYSDKQIKELGKTWKKYEKLSAGEKKAVQEDSVYKAFQKLLTSLGKRYHFDQATGINLDDNKEDALPWYVKMVVDPKLADESEIETIQKVLGKKSEILSLSEIRFVDTLTGDSWKPEDILKVQLPMADLGDYESCMIVHITDKGKVEFLKGKVSDSYIIFDAAEFSAYGIVGFMGNSEDILSGQEESQPVWPWIAGGGAACVLVILMGAVRFASSRKKKDSTEHE